MLQICTFAIHKMSYEISKNCKLYKKNRDLNRTLYTTFRSKFHYIDIKKSISPDGVSGLKPKSAV